MHSYMIAIIYDEMHPLLERVHATLIKKTLIQSLFTGQKSEY
ncbi:Uncharacterised protein [Candidatus Bartonella washoeensis]|uniref:Uncharacterized protein n=1 Tax=Candidatus Bartonella washoeensis Sb944nv TaxID=1094563 RepID=J0PYW3_9HYPH|nr:hypothetical protein MCQ_01329 [Bartonella washoeensis Sb944nv]SPU27547.1 Uncharacterised protein [Bartonella washoeensis]